MDSPLSVINYLYYLAVKESKAREEEEKERKAQEEAERRKAKPNNRNKRVPFMKPPSVGRLEAEAFEDELLGG